MAGLLQRTPKRLGTCPRLPLKHSNPAVLPRPYTSIAPQSSVRIIEVAARDGLQNISTNVPTPLKIELIRRLLDTGLTNVEATSFVSPKWIPQLADNKDVFAAVSDMTRGRDDVSLPVLIPNVKGLTQAIESGAKEVVVFASASEGFSWKNTNCSLDQGLDRAQEVARAALAQGMRVRGVVSCIVGCPYDGPTTPAKVLHVVKRLLSTGCYEVGLGDTVGVGTPADIETLLRVLLTEIPANRLAGHFHDTYGQGVANAVKAYEMGIRAFDSSVAGLGGCPYARGAKGNLASEDMIYTFQKAGVQTGVDLQRLSEVGDWITKTLKLPNNSRAGSALTAQAFTTTQSTPPAPVKKSRTWHPISDEGSYRVSQSGTAIKITLTRPQNGNALTTSMVTGITELFHKLSYDKTIFHIVLESEGKFFCTGMDLSSSASSASDDPDEKARYYHKVRDLFMAIEQAPQTTIAAIEGSCFGGGVGLAFVFDIRVVSAKTKFTMTEITLGLTPAVISRFLVREWGPAFLREAMLTGRAVSGDELKRVGAVHSVSEDVQGTVDGYLDVLRNCAPKAGSKVKELIQMGYENAGSQELQDNIRNTFARMMEPGSEGEFGMVQFRKKIKGTLDWEGFWKRKSQR